MSEAPQYTPSQVASALKVEVDQVFWLGTGSFGETWRVSDAGQDTAYKIFYRDGYQPERLEREISGLQRVDHRGVVRIISHGDLVIKDRSRPYIEFEYIPGGDIEHWLNKQSPASNENLHLLLWNLLEAVESMHEAQVVHRDIKPANIALRDGNIENPVILDLGLAKPLDAGSITIYPGHIGTPKYMAPEQIRAERAQMFADLWAVGVVVAEVAMSRHPFFDFQNATITIDQALALQKSTIQLPGELPETLVKTILKLLSYKPYKRGTATSALRLLNG
ncbi:serine/threonine-protein kinase [Amycolatopsis sp. NPDC088138]|uniref:serine/threonine-protein kinase n=1 Tax=Amycolatopsis sp. NPDC088138 TaxID=3363938 RepID=UPI003817B1E8